MYPLSLLPCRRFLLRHTGQPQTKRRSVDARREENEQGREWARTTPHRDGVQPAENRDLFGQYVRFFSSIPSLPVRLSLLFRLCQSAASLRAVEREGKRRKAGDGKCSRKFRRLRKGRKSVRRLREPHTAHKKAWMQAGFFAVPQTGGWGTAVLCPQSRFLCSRFVEFVFVLQPQLAAFPTVTGGCMQGLQPFWLSPSAAAKGFLARAFPFSLSERVVRGLSSWGPERSAICVGRKNAERRGGKVNGDVGAEVHTALTS